MIRQVLLASDARGIVMLKIALFSLLKTTDATKPLTIYLAHDHSFTDAGCQQEIAKIIQQFPFANIVLGNFEPLYELHKARINTEGMFWPPMTWARVFFAELFPKISGQLLYIDIDTCINGDLEELFSIDLASENKLFAGVVECTYGKATKGDTYIPPDSKYCNAGVLVINTDAYKQENTQNKIIDWYAQHRSISRYLDQDSINAIGHNRFAYLPMKWNYNDMWLRKYKSLDISEPLWVNMYPTNEALEAMLSPKIIHFEGRYKPHKFNHRPERNRARKVMIELGLTKYLLPGETGPKFIEGLLFDLKHYLIKQKLRKLQEALNRGLN